MNLYLTEELGLDYDCPNCDKQMKKNMTTLTCDDCSIQCEIDEWYRLRELRNKDCHSQYWEEREKARNKRQHEFFMKEEP